MMLEQERIAFNAGNPFALIIFLSASTGKKRGLRVPTALLKTFIPDSNSW